MSDGQIPGGAAVLFESGGTFYGRLRCRQWVSIGAYGVGTRPVITPYKILTNAAGWSLHTAGVWKINLTAPVSHGGWTGAETNIGFLLVDDVVRAARQTTLAALSAAWDFYCDATHLYVQAAANPATLAADLRAAPDGNVIDARNWLTITGIEITGGGGHGVGGRGNTVTIRGCKIHHLGGSYLRNYQDGTVRYGNGVEVGIGSSNWLVEDNEISECYDVGYTAQGAVTYDPVVVTRQWIGWRDIVARSNVIHNCTQSVEFWSGGATALPGAGFVNVVFEDNACSAAGESVFASVRPAQDNRVHVLTYGWTLPADVVIRGNLFDGSAGAYRYSSNPTPGLVSENNTIKLAAGHKMQYQHSETIEQAAAWATAHGTETGSTFVVL